MFTIEKDIPFPLPKRASKTRRSDRGTRQKLPLAQMEIGDSLYVPEAFMPRRNVQIMASKLALDFGRLYRTKPENQGCRIWRLK